MTLRFDVVDAEGPKRYYEGLVRGSLAHAYLFAGPPGVGKKTFARRLAQSLLCLAPHESVLGYDGTCTSCMLFGAGENTRHPDFFEHVGVLKIGERESAAGFSGGEDLTARDVVRQLSLQSYSGGLRVLLLGDVDFATRHAANALLKFLEEPPRGVITILTTATPGRLLSTIRSRLVEVRFALLPEPAVAEIVQRLGHSQAEAKLAASLSGGSVTRALAILEGEEESLRAVVVRWFFESARGRSPDVPWASRDTLDEGLEIAKMLARDWIVVSQVGDRGIGALFMRDCAKELAALPKLATPQALDLLAKIDQAQRLARTNVSPVMASEIVRMALAPATTKVP
jgi:DNA polymerase III subunit delta'